MGKEEDIMCESCRRQNILTFMQWVRKNGYIQSKDGWFLSRLINHGIYSDEELYQIYLHSLK
jgi:hypothetical protein